MHRARLRQPGSRSRATPYEYNLAMIQPGTGGRVIKPSRTTTSIASGCASRFAVATARSDPPHAREFHVPVEKRLADVGFVPLQH